MDNKEVYFEIIMPKSSYLNYRLGITKTLAPGETAIAAWNIACAEAEQWHKDRHPELYKFNDKPLTVEETDLVQEINVADFDTLTKRLKDKILKDFPNLKKYYMERLQTLTDNFKTH